MAAWVPFVAYTLVDCFAEARDFPGARGIAHQAWDSFGRSYRLPPQGDLSSDGDWLLVWRQAGLDPAEIVPALLGRQRDGAGLEGIEMVREEIRCTRLTSPRVGPWPSPPGWAPPRFPRSSRRLTGAASPRSTTTAVRLVRGGSRVGGQGGPDPRLRGAPHLPRLLDQLALLANGPHGKGYSVGASGGATGVRGRLRRAPHGHRADAGVAPLLSELVSRTVAEGIHGRT